MDSEAVMAIGLFAGVASVCWSAAFAWAKWLQYRRTEPSTPEIAQRLDRIEQAIDTVALEVERLGEGQRFAVKLLRDRSGAIEGSESHSVNTPR